MAMKILAEDCTACGACEFECPNAAIKAKGATFIIKESACTECDGEAPKCVAVCPTDCIVKA